MKSLKQTKTVVIFHITVKFVVIVQNSLQHLDFAVVAVQCSHYSRLFALLPIHDHIPDTSPGHDFSFKAVTGIHINSCPVIHED